MRFPIPSATTACPRSRGGVKQHNLSTASTGEAETVTGRAASAPVQSYRAKKQAPPAPPNHLDNVPLAVWKLSRVPARSATETSRREAARSPRGGPSPPPQTKQVLNPPAASSHPSCKNRLLPCHRSPGTPWYSRGMSAFGLARGTIEPSRGCSRSFERPFRVRGCLERVRRFASFNWLWKFRNR